MLKNILLFILIVFQTIQCYAEWPEFIGFAADMFVDGGAKTKGFICQNSSFIVDFVVRLLKLKP